MIGLLPMSEDITKQKDVTERLSSGKGLYLKQNLPNFTNSYSQFFYVNLNAKLI